MHVHISLWNRKTGTNLLSLSEVPRSSSLTLEMLVDSLDPTMAQFLGASTLGREDIGGAIHTPAVAVPC